MNKRQLVDRLETVEKELRSAEFQAATAFQKALAQEQKDGFWVSLDSSTTKRNRSWKDIEQNLKDVFAAHCVNPFAKSFVDYMRYFVIGKGTLISADESEGEGIDESPQQRIDTFCELNDWSKMEKDICGESSRDGEVFVRFHDTNPNDVQATVASISLVDPLEITAIDAKDVNSPERYLRKWTEVLSYDDNGTPTTKNRSEWIDASEIHHIKFNAGHNETRGRSDLLPALPYLKQMKGWLDDMSRRNYMANSFVWDVTTSGGIKPSAVTGAYPQGPAPGSVIAHTEQEMWKVNAPDLKWADSTEGLRAIKLFVCALFKMPESWFGDTGESNLATTKALTMPTLKAFTDRQDELKNHFEQIISRGARVEKVNVYFPELVVEDAKVKAEGLYALANALVLLTNAGLISRETAYSVLQNQLEDLDDWEGDDSGSKKKPGEKVRIEADETSDVLAIAQGRKMPRPGESVEPGAA